MPDIALCANHESCDYAGKCDRHPGTYITISDRQSWAYFKGTEECLDKAVMTEPEGRKERP